MSVAELSAGIGAALSRAFPDEVWVRGEVANLNRPPSGHVYFDLVGDGCALGVTLWASDKQVVNAVLRRAGGAVRMTDGTEVRIRVRRVVVRGTRPRVAAHALDRHGVHARPPGRGARGAAAHAAGRRSPAPSGRPDAAAGADCGSASSRATAAPPPTTSSARSRRAGTRGASPCSTPACRVRPRSDRSSTRSTRHACRRSAASTSFASCAAAAREPISRSSTARPSRARSRLAPVVVWTGIGHEIDTTVADAVAHRQLPHADRMRDGARRAGHPLLRSLERHLECHRPRRVASPAHTRRGARRVRATSRDVSGPRARPRQPDRRRMRVATCGPSIRPDRWPAAGASPTTATEGWCDRPPTSPPARSW